MLPVFPRSFRAAAFGLAVSLIGVSCSQGPQSPASPGSSASAGADLMAGPTDGGVTPTVIEGSPACSAVPGYTPEWQQLRLDNREWRTPGTYGTFFTVLPNAVPTHFFGWSATSLIVVKAVLMNGGTSAHVYSYNAVTPPVVSTDTHLHSPVASNGKPAPISHVTFCYVKPVTKTGDGEGCTPGFWKNRGITIGAWDAAGVSPDATVSSVFAIGAFPTIGGTSLHAALDFGGGPGTEGAARILIRAAVAAYLNASHGDLSYPLTAAEVVAQVNAALVKGSSTDNQWRQRMLSLGTSLDTQNNLGCPL